MEECYRYSRLRALFLYGSFIIIPICLLLSYKVFLINHPREDAIEAFLYVLASMLPFFMVPFILMISKLSVRILIDERGIVYRSLFKNLDLQWNEVYAVRLQYSAEFGVMRGGKHLDIRGANKKRIKVVDFIMNCETMDSWEGLDELEATVRKHTLANRPAPMVADSVSTDVTLSPVSVSDEHGAEETTTENRRQNVIFQMVLLPIVCLVLVHYFTKDIQKTAELVGYATLIFLPVMLVIRKMLILESQGKLTRNAYILTTVIGSILLALSYSLLRKKDYANASVLFILTVEVIMFLSYIYLKRGTLHFPPLEQPSDENAGGPPRKGSV